MDGLRRSLPALGHLAVFEAAARAGNFTRAGRGLGMSQAAVSYAVRALEGDLGIPLFVRRGRQVALTSSGEALFRAVSAGFGDIRGVVAAIRERAQDGKVSLSVSGAFATFWLLPRLPGFRARFPDIDLQVRAVDRDIDIAAEGIALGVRYGPGILPFYARAVIAWEAIRPVCSPDFAARTAAWPGVPAPAEIACLPLIHLDEPHRPCPPWRDWFAAHGVDYRGNAGVRFNEYALAIQAALDGQGVVLGWRHLVAALVARGALVPLIATHWRTDVCYCVVWSGTLAPKAERVRDWLVEEAAGPALSE